MIARLRALGAAIAIDDFGTGYSSMGYLTAFRVNRIKIAQEFIRDFVNDPADAAIVHATIGLARELGIEVIAEGVETAEQCDVLVKAGCDSIQGYYFSRPVSAAEASRMLSKGWLEPALPDTGPKAPNTKSGADVPALDGDIHERGNAA